MSTRAGIGYSEDPDSEVAGRQSAQAAMARAGTSECDLALLFSTSKHDPVKLLRSVRSVVGPAAKIVGGGTAGIITNDLLGYEGSQVGVAVLRSDSVGIRTFIQPGLESGERDVGRKLGAMIRRAVGADNPPLLLMYESVKESTERGPILNMGTPFLDGLRDSLGTWPSIVGLALHGDPQWKPGLQYFDDRLTAQSAIAAVFTGQVRMDTLTMTNLVPMSTYRVVTKTDGPALLEIDGCPALDVISELLGSALSPEEYPLSLTLGVNKGEKFGHFREEHYAVHLCVGVDRSRKALIMDDRMADGAEFQLMRRHMNFVDIRQRAEKLVRSIRDRQPFLAIYVDCAGRASIYAGTEGEEAAEIQAAVGSQIPLLGMYSGGEISSVAGRLQRLTNAGVLCLFSEPG